MKNEIRPPAYPLVMIDHKINAWSMTDTLYNDDIRHWSGRKMPLVGALRVDGETYRFMGTSNIAMKPLLPISKDGEWEGKYTFIQPESDWKEQDFDDSKWQTGKAAFGTKREFNVQTIWPTPDIWLRREITLAESISEQDSLILTYSHDETFELYINGIQLVKTGNEWHQNVEVGIPDHIKKTFLDGKITIAAHCNNMIGASLVDFGIYTIKEQPYLEKVAFQKSVDVQATQTNYNFECGDVELRLNFISPFIATDLVLLSSPFNYISYEIRSLDGKPHDIQIYFEASPYWASNENKRMNKPEYSEARDIILVKTGNIEQKLLDPHAAGWGYFCMGGEKKNSTVSSGHAADLQEEFALNGRLVCDTTTSRNSNIAIAQHLGVATRTSGHIMVGVDDIFSISYFGDNLRPYWNRNNDRTIEHVFNDAKINYKEITRQCQKLDYEIMSTARCAGGKEYAELCALAYRQTIAANTLVQGSKNEPLYFNRELGNIGVVTSSSPLFLYFNPELVKAFMNPLFEYSESGKWPKVYPAHNLGVYPVVSHQDFYDMPVEAAGNMLILTAAITAAEGNGVYADKHWEILTRWNSFLIQNGIDTKDQPSVDTFTEMIPHNTNLSIKAVIGIASYAYMAKRLDKSEMSEKYFAKAREMAAQWEQMSYAGDHYRIAFGAPDSSWSQKYNLVWDKVLDLGIFPDSIYRKELAYYKTKQNKYGLPLDYRNQFANTDWIAWIAAMAGDKDEFREFINPLHLFMNKTTDRVPMADFINTNTITQQGFRASSVVGAYYMKLFEEKLNAKNNEITK